MAARGRVKGITLTNEHRDKIKNSNILSYLIAHIEGRRKMNATQVHAGLGLLRKVLPDLAVAADTNERGELVLVTGMTDAELETIAAGGRDGTAAPAPGARLVN